MGWWVVVEGCVGCVCVGGGGTEHTPMMMFHLGANDGFEKCVFLLVNNVEGIFALVRSKYICDRVHIADYEAANADYKIYIAPFTCKLCPLL